MEMDVTNRERNELLNREEIELALSHTGEATPSENTIRDRLAAELDIDPLTIQVDHVYSRTGSGTSTAHVKVFDEPIMDELPEDESEADGDADESSEAAAEDADPAEEETDAEDEEQEEDAEVEEADEDADEASDAPASEDAEPDEEAEEEENE